MTWTLKANGGSGATNPNLAEVTLDSRGANLIIIGAAWYNGINADVAADDTPLNSWTALTKKNTTDRSAMLWYCIGPTTNVAHQFRVAGTSTYPSIFVQVWECSVTPSFRNESGNVATAGTTLANLAAVGAAGDLLSAVCNSGTGGASGITLDSSFTVPDKVLAGSTAFGAMGYLEPASGAVNPTWTWGATTDHAAAAIAAFIDSSYTPPGGFKPYFARPGSRIVGQGVR
jgi:hypothetical protein